MVGLMKIKVAQAVVIYKLGFVGYNRSVSLHAPCPGILDL